MSITGHSDIWCITSRVCPSFQRGIGCGRTSATLGIGSCNCLPNKKAKPLEAEWYIPYWQLWGCGTFLDYASNNIFLLCSCLWISIAADITFYPSHSFSNNLPKHIYVHSDQLWENSQPIYSYRMLLDFALDVIHVEWRRKQTYSFSSELYILLLKFKKLALVEGQCHQPFKTKVKTFIHQN